MNKVREFLSRLPGYVVLVFIVLSALAALWQLYLCITLFIDATKVPSNNNIPIESLFKQSFFHLGLAILAGGICYLGIRLWIRINDDN